MVSQKISSSRELRQVDISPAVSHVLPMPSVSVSVGRGGWPFAWLDL